MHIQIGKMILIINISLTSGIYYTVFIIKISNNQLQHLQMTQIYIL